MVDFNDNFKVMCKRYGKTEDINPTISINTYRICCFVKSEQIHTKIPQMLMFSSHVVERI